MEYIGNTQNENNDFDIDTNWCDEQPTMNTMYGYDVDFATYREVTVLIDIIFEEGVNND